MSKQEALRHVIRPALKLCLRRMLKLQDFIECAKEVIIDLAQQELEEHGEKVTVSALCVMTGIHRREVSRIVNNVSKSVDQSNLAIRVLNRWQNDPDFLTRARKPRTLNYSDEFQELVRRESSDVNPKSFIFELKRAGAIEVKQGRVKLLTKELFIQTDPGESIALLSLSGAI